MKRLFSTLFFLFSLSNTFAQHIKPDSSQTSKDLLDSLYISEIEAVKGKDKVLHAEPLFIDLIRDLGARKGEKEWNVGMGMTDHKNYDTYSTLVEYEFAPIDRLGFEIELPFSFSYPLDTLVKKSEIPQNRLNGLKLATQYSFFVSEKYSTSMAIGYIHEFEMTNFKQYGKKRLFEGNVYNPFFVAAKRWTDNMHTLLYTGPYIQHHFKDNSLHTTWQINSNFHYMISGTKNFIGVELNKEINKRDFDMTIRPQMRLTISDKMLVGIVTGIPINRESQRFSTFIRVIYEPSHRSKHKSASFKS